MICQQQKNEFSLLFAEIKFPEFHPQLVRKLRIVATFNGDHPQSVLADRDLRDLRIFDVTIALAAYFILSHDVHLTIHNIFIAKQNASTYIVQQAVVICRVKLDLAHVPVHYEGPSSGIVDYPGLKIIADD
jgi:hypothetical protein